MNNENRRGRFTSSNIFKLIPEGTFHGFQKPAITYIKDKQIEIRMKRCLDVGGYSQTAAWGEFMEMVIFNLLGLEYKISSKETKLHPDKLLSRYWSGSCDLEVPGIKIGEIKCYQPKNFALYSDALLKKDIEVLKKDFKQEYWQMVSNAAIHQVKRAEAIAYMPYESEMEDIRDLAASYEGADMWKYRFIYEKPSSELAVLPNDGYYCNVNNFEFKVPQEDIDLLEIRVLEASQLLKNINL